MIVDITGVELIPGNGGRDCPGNGEDGNEICCDECNYLGCCLEYHRKKPCNECVHLECPRNQNDGLKSEIIEALHEQLKNNNL